MARVALEVTDIEVGYAQILPTQLTSPGLDWAASFNNPVSEKMTMLIVTNTNDQLVRMRAQSNLTEVNGVQIPDYRFDVGPQATRILWLPGKYYSDADDVTLVGIDDINGGDFAKVDFTLVKLLPAFQ